MSTDFSRDRICPLLRRITVHNCYIGNRKPWSNLTSSTSGALRKRHGRGLWSIPTLLTNQRKHNDKNHIWITCTVQIVKQMASPQDWVFKLYMNRNAASSVFVQQASSLTLNEVISTGWYRLQGTKKQSAVQFRGVVCFFCCCSVCLFHY